MEPTQTILDSEIITTEYDPRVAIASGGKRFANYLIDLVFFYLQMFLLVIVLATMSVTIPEEDHLLQVIGLFMYALYCFVFESSLGKTPPNSSQEHSWLMIRVLNQVYRRF